MLAHALRPALHGESGEVEELLLRVGAGLAGADKGDAAALILKRCPHAPFFQPKAGGKIREGMLDPPAAQRPQKKHLGKALLTGKLSGIFGVGVVLDVRLQ